jgi:hypothetical protein
VGQYDPKMVRNISRGSNLESSFPRHLEVNHGMTFFYRYEFTGLLAKMRLVCIDEVHMLNEERGSVLEVIVARMKTLGTSESKVSFVMGRSYWIFDLIKITLFHGKI